MSELPLEDAPDVADAAHEAARGEVVYLTEDGPVAVSSAQAVGGEAYISAVAEQSAAVEPAPLPAAMLRLSNPVVRLLLRSPVGGPMRKQFMVLRFAGRKTGRRYDIPVVAHRLDGELYALTGLRWRHNFRDGADAEVTLDGQVTRMRGQLIEDPAAVAPIYARSIDHFGVKRAQRMLGLKIHTPGTPTAEALAEAARRYHLSAIQFTAKT